MSTLHIKSKGLLNIITNSPINKKNRTDPEAMSAGSAVKVIEEEEIDVGVLTLWGYFIFNMSVPLFILLPIHFLLPRYVSSILSLAALSLSLYIRSCLSSRLKARQLFLYTCVVSGWILWSYLNWGPWFNSEPVIYLTGLLQAFLTFYYFAHPDQGYLCILQTCLFIFVPIYPLVHMGQPEVYIRIFFMLLTWISDVLIGGVHLGEEVNEAFLLMTSVPFLRLHLYPMLVYACIVLGFRGLHFRTHYEQKQKELAVTLPIKLMEEGIKKDPVPSPESSLPSPVTVNVKRLTKEEEEKEKKDKKKRKKAPPEKPPVTPETKPPVLPEGYSLLHSRKKYSFPPSPLEVNLLTMNHSRPKFPQGKTPGEEFSEVSSQQSSQKPLPVDISKSLKPFEGYLL